MVRNDKQSRNRRDVLKLTGVSGVALLAGCVSTTDDEDTTDGGNGGGSDGGDDGGSDGGTDDGSDGEDGGSDGGDTSPYKIGMVDSVSGSLSAFGQRNQRGKDLAIADVNAEGIGGRDLEITVEDSQSEAQAGVSAAQKLVNQDEVPFLIGAVGSSVSLAIYQSVIQGTDVVQLSQNSTSPDLTNFPGLLRMSPTGSVQAGALADLISNDGYDDVAITYINNDYGKGITDSFTEAYDGNVAYEQSHDQGQSSYSNVVSGMANADADAWLFITYQPEFSTMAQEAYSSGYEAQFYGADSAKGPKILENTPEGSLDGMKVVAPSAAIDQDNYKQFASRFEDEHGSEPTAWSAYAYDCVVNAALAIHTANEFTGAALQETVRDVTRPEGEKVSTYAEALEVLGDDGSASDIDYEGVSGPIDFDENGDPVGFLQVFTVQNHEYVSTGTIASE